jgi:hypothetical protein
MNRMNRMILGILGLAMAGTAHAQAVGEPGRAAGTPNPLNKTRTSIPPGMRSTTSTSIIRGLLAVLVLAAAPLSAYAQGHEGAEDHHELEVEPQGDHDHAANPPHGSLANVGAKLANPLSDLWSMQMNFQGPTFFDGDLVSGSPEVGGSLIVQPVMPIPMYGSGEDTWRLIVRPILPIIFSQPKLDDHLQRQGGERGQVERPHRDLRRQDDQDRARPGQHSCGPRVLGRERGLLRQAGQLPHPDHARSSVADPEIHLRWQLEERSS